MSVDLSVHGNHLLTMCSCFYGVSIFTQLSILYSSQHRPPGPDVAKIICPYYSSTPLIRPPCLSRNYYHVREAAFEERET